MLLLQKIYRFRYNFYSVYMEVKDINILELNEKSDFNSQQEGRYLTFTLDKNYYGIPILMVNEIIGVVPITTIPKTPASIKGIINLRGKIIPVMDLRIKFGMPEREYDHSTCIIIIHLTVNGEARQVGVIVDIVSEVCDIPASEIENPPSY